MQHPSDAIAPIEDFPLLAAQAGGEKGLVYLDNAATTQKPACVLDAMDAFYRTGNANPHRSTHRLAAAATDALEDARSCLARFTGADVDEVVFTSGTTLALNTIAYGLSAALRQGDEVVLSLLDHHSNIVPWQTVAKRAGAKIVYLVPDRSGHLTDEEIERVISPRTRIVAITHTSNVLGTLLPLSRIVQTAHACQALVVLDCAQCVAHLPLDVHALDVDFAAFSGHKMYGPLGIGVLFGKRERLAELSPLLRGGGMVQAVFEQAFMFKNAPEGFEAGTQNVAGALGLAEAARYLNRLGFGAIRAHEDALTRHLVAGLAAIPSVKLYGPTPDDTAPRCGIAAFTVRGVSAGDAAYALNKRDVAVRAGAHCAEPLIRHLGAEAVCRASIGVYTTRHDIDRFLEAVEYARADAVAFLTSLSL